MFVLVPTGDLSSQSSDTLMSLRTTPIPQVVSVGSAGARYLAGSLGCAVVQYGRPVPSELGWGGLSRFSLLPGGLVFCVWGCGERPCDTLRALPENVATPRGSRWARLYATSGGCVEVSVASVATSGCPKRSEGGCPCRSEDVHRTSSQQHGRLQTHESPPQPKSHSGQSFQKVIRLQDRPNPHHKLTEILHVLTLLQQANAKTSRNLSIILK